MPSPEQSPETMSDQIKSNEVKRGEAETAITSPASTGSAAAPLKLPQLTANDRSEARSLPANENETFMLMQSWQRRRNAIALRSKQHLPAIIMFCGTGLSAMWLAAAVVYVHNTVGWKNVTNLMPHEIGGFLAGLLAPVALFWMVLTFWLRSVDVKLYAETLRQEVQAMIFPSEEAEKRVNSDIERLMRQTAEMSRATRNALSTLQQARQAMHSEALAMHTGARQTADRLEEVEKRLVTRNEKLIDLQKDMEGKSSFLVQASDKMVQDATQLDKTVNQTSETARIIGDLLKAPLGDLQKWQDEVVQAIAGSTNKITTERDALRVDIADLEEKATAVATVLQKGTSRIYDFTDDALDKAKLIETRLQGQGLALEQVLNQINTQAEHLSTRHDKIMQDLQGHTFDGQQQLSDNAKMLEQLLNQMGQARSTLKGTIDSLGETTAMSVDQINTLAKTMQSGITDSTVATVQTITGLSQHMQDGINQSTASSVQKMTDMSQQMQDGISQSTASAVERLSQLMDAVRVKLSEATNVSIEQLSALAVRLQNELTQSVGKTGESAQQNLKYLSERTADYVQQFSGMVTSAADHATEQSRKLLNDTRAAMADERSQLDGYMSNLITQNKAKLVETAESFAGLRNHMDGLISVFVERQVALDQTGHDVVGRADTVRTMLQEAFAYVSAKTSELEKGVAAVTDAIAQPLDKMAKASVLAMEQAQITSNMFEQKISAMHGLGETLSNTAKTIGQDIDDSARSLQTSMIQIHNDMSGIKTGLSDHAQTLDNRVKAMLSQVTVVIPQLDRVNTQLSTLNTQTSQAHQNLLQLDENILTNSKHIITLSDETVDRVQQSLERYAELGQRYETVSKTGLDAFAQVHETYQKGVSDLSFGAQQARSTIDDANQLYNKLTGTLETLESHADTSRKMADSATSAITSVQNTLAQATSQMDEQTLSSLQQIEKLQQTLGQAHTSFTQRAAELKDVARQSEEQAMHLAIQTQTLNEATQDNTDTLAKSTETLRRTLEESGLQASQVEAFNNHVATLNEQMQQHQAMIRDQAEALEKAAYDAVEKASHIRALEQSLQRDHFFTSAKFVVESLHSLALDFTRMLEGELPEKTWKAYQRGETSVFAKRLVSTRDHLSHEKLRQKYSDDVEFRTYVQRYMRQFEEMHDQAKTHDHGELLSSVFVSSDVGRLYQFLQDVLKNT